MSNPQRAARATLLALAALAGACATTPKPQGDAEWPAPPDPPRIRYVRTIRTPADLPSSGWQALRKVFFGTDKTLAVFNPTALALSPDDRRLYVACTASARVLEIDLVKGGIKLAAASGRRPKHPFGLATDALGNLYVADQLEKVVLVYEPGGAFLREIGRKKLERPTGLAVDRRRQVLYVTEGGKVDDRRHQIEVFSLDGKHLRTIGTRGQDAGQFNFPSYLAVGPDGLLYVADTLNFRIQMFDPQGALLGMFGSANAGIGGFNKLKGLAFDTAGNLHAADAANSMVQIFNPNQQLLLPYGGLGPDLPLMQTPNGIAIDSRNNIYVADLVLNRVNQYVLVDASGSDGAASPKAPAAKPASASPPAKR
jgi:sugar lactone lactonase YvrE